MSLYEHTRHLHHICEEHPIGKAMSQGTITAQQWCDWLYALSEIHRTIDPRLPPYVHVTGELTLDIVSMLPLIPNHSPAAVKFCKTLTCPQAVLGTAYVLVGAHKRGGKLTEKRFKENNRDLPIRHVNFFAPVEAEAFVRYLREQDSLAPYAILAFEALLRIMDEIYVR